MYNTLMYLPVNKIHWYVGLPIVLFIAIRGLMQYKKDKNILNLYVGLIGSFYSLCFIFYGLPLLITDNNTVLKFTTIAGDCMQFVGLFFVWLGVIRSYITKNKQLSSAMGYFALILLIVSIFISIQTNLSSQLTLTQSTSGMWSIQLPSSIALDVIMALQYMSFLLFGAFFAYQARFNKDRLRKIRMYAISIILFAVGALYVIQPFLSFFQNSRLPSIIIAGVLFIAGIFIFSSVILNSQKK